MRNMARETFARFGRGVNIPFTHLILECRMAAQAEHLRSLGQQLLIVGRMRGMAVQALAAYKGLVSNWSML